VIESLEKMAANLTPQIAATKTKEEAL